jgi:hypothetical protein
MFPSFLRSCLALALPALAVACAAETSNDAPIIDSVDAPLAVTAKDGAYSIPISLLFHDNDGEAITRLRYRLPPNIEGMVDVPAPNPTKESAEVTIVIPISALDGPDTSPTVPNSQGEKRDPSDARRPEDQSSPRGRGRRALHISIVDGRGAESLPQYSTVTLY